LEEGTTYIQVSAGDNHTVILRSDGCAVACGKNLYGQCDIPPLKEGIIYTQVSAGLNHTVLLQSDGQAVACGKNDYGQTRQYSHIGRRNNIHSGVCRWLAHSASPK